MEKEIEEFRQRVSHLHRPRRGTPYPPEIRARAVELAAALESAGHGPHAIGRRLGIRAETLASWSVARPTGLARVVVQLSEVHEPEPEPVPRSMTVTSPGGWRIEGIGLAEFEVLARVLA